jgi:hypothetical protein
MVGGSLEVSQSDMIKKAEVATGIATSSPIYSVRLDPCGLELLGTHARHGRIAHKF